MANQGAKKRKEENEKHIQMLQRLIVYVNAAYILIRVSLFFSSFSLVHWGGLLFTTLTYKFCFDKLVYMATPVYDEKGGLLDGGADLSMGGMCAYLHDIIYVTAFVQVASIFSDWFWLVWLIVPLYALWLLVTEILIPLYNQPAQGEESKDERSRKKREKMERKSARTAKLMQQRR